MAPVKNAALCAVVVCATSTPLFALHGGLFRGAPTAEGPSKAPVTTTNTGGVSSALGSSASFRPTAGGGPEMPFSDDLWEFWWEFNHDRSLALRPSLARRAASTPGSEFAFVDNSTKTQRILPRLLASLRDRDPDVRSASAFALARTGLSDVVPYLRHTLATDPSLIVRENVVLALGQVRSARSIDTLSEVLDDTKLQDELRAYAAVALGTTGLPEASQILRDRCAQTKEGGPAYTLRVALLYALGLTEDPANAPFLRELAVRGENDERLRALVLVSLGRVGDRASVTLLAGALQDSGAQVRRAAAIALGVVCGGADAGGREALQRAATRDSDGVVRNLADLSLGRIAARGSDDALEFLVKELRDSTSRRRGSVAIALGLSEREEARAPLLATFRTENAHNLQAAAAIGLALAHHAEAAPTLRQALEKNRDPYLRGYLSLALGMLGDADSVEELQECLRTASGPEEMRWSAVGLALLGDPGLETELEELAVSGSSWQRSTALYCTGLVGGVASVDFLVERAGASDETELTRAYAHYALGMLCDREAEAVASVYARDHDYTADLPFLGDLYFLY